MRCDTFVLDLTCSCFLLGFGPVDGVSARKVRFNRRFGHVVAITGLEATTSQCIDETLMFLSLEEDSEPTNLMESSRKRK
jgi:hypothetical protein